MHRFCSFPLFYVRLWRRQSRAILLLVSFLLLASVTGRAQEYYYLPNETVTRQGQTIQLRHQNKILTYDLQMRRWLEPYSGLEPLAEQQGQFYASYATLRALALSLPRLRRIRSSNNDAHRRIVLELESSAGLQPFEHSGELAANTPLRVNLPALFVPAELYQELTSRMARRIGGIESIDLRGSLRQTTLELDPSYQGSLRYKVFSLSNPMRLVIDFEYPPDANIDIASATVDLGEDEAQVAALPTPVGSSLPAATRPPPLAATSAAPTPVAPPLPVPAPTSPFARVVREVAEALPARPGVQETIAEYRRSLRPGVTYRRFSVPTPEGSSGVHLLEIAPNSGVFRVVGNSGQGRTISQLASGALAAINASYFNTESFVSIGLLKVDDALSSLPSRGRAAISFDGNQRPRISRIQREVSLMYRGQRIVVQSYNRSSPLFIYDRVGETVGSPQQGVILVRDGRVIAHRAGPLTISPESFAVVYAPSLADQALYQQMRAVRNGERMELETRYSPNTFQRMASGVEAGPLLVERGRSAYQPELENFRRGQRILDGRTQQAAIGVKADGTVLLLTADSMIAEELVPLFIELGAREAMRLDSGSSASLFVDGSVVNRNGERQIVTAIAFTPY